MMVEQIVGGGDDGKGNWTGMCLTTMIVVVVDADVFAVDGNDQVMMMLLIVYYQSHDNYIPFQLVDEDGGWKMIDVKWELQGMIYHDLMICQAVYHRGYLCYH